MASALFKKFQDEQAKKDAEYKAWEADQWKQHGAQWEKEGYKRQENSNTAWGSNWSFKNPVSNPPGDVQTVVETKPETKPVTKVETPPVKTSTFASYDNLMQQNWARKSAIGSNNGWVDENGQFIINPAKYTGKKFQTFVTTNLYGDHNDVTYAYDPETGNVRAMSENMLGKAKGWASAGDEGSVNNGSWGSLSDMLAQYGITYKKQGGTMNKVKYFAQGGQPQTQNDIQRQVEALVEAALSGDQKANQQVNQIMEAAKAGDQKAAELAQMIQVAAQKLQGQVTSSKWGSKLHYIRSLKFAKGGKNCPACMAAEGQTKEKLKTYIAPSDTVHVQGKPKSLVDSQGKKTAYGCGGKTGKAKKHQEGGWMEMLPLYGTYQSGKRFFKNPSWKAAGEFGLDLAGDAALLTGVGAGAGAALKAAKVANTINKGTKLSKGLKTAKNILVNKPAGGYQSIVNQTIGKELTSIDDQAKAFDQVANMYNFSKQAPLLGAEGFLGSKVIDQVSK